MKEQRTGLIQQLVNSLFDRVGREAFTSDAVTYISEVGDWQSLRSWIVNGRPIFRASFTSGGIPQEIRTTQYFGDTAFVPLQDVHEDLEDGLRVLSSFASAESMLVSAWNDVHGRVQKTRSFIVNPIVPSGVLPWSVNDLLPLSGVLILYLYLRFYVYWQAVEVSERSIPKESRYLSFPTYGANADVIPMSIMRLIYKLMWFTWLLLPLLVLYVSIVCRFNIAAPLLVREENASMLASIFSTRSYDTFSVALDYLNLLCLAVILAATLAVTSIKTEGHVRKTSNRSAALKLIGCGIVFGIGAMLLWSLVTREGQFFPNGMDPRSSAVWTFGILLSILSTFFVGGVLKKSGFTIAICVIGIGEILMIM